MNTFLVLFRHAWRKSFEQKINIAILLLLPVAIVFIPPHESTFPFGMYIYGLVNLFSAFTLSRTIMEDRIRGMMVRIIAAPVKYIEYMGAHMLAFMLILTVQNLLFLLLANLRWNEYIFSNPAIFLLYFCYNMMSITLALAWNVMFHSYSLSFALYSGFASILCLVTGVTIPLFLFPDQLRRYVAVLPTYWLSNGLEAIYNQRQDTVIPAALVLMAYGVLFLIAGSRKKYV